MPPQDKVFARAAVHTWLDASLRSVFLRINAADTPWFEQDLTICSHPAVAGVMLPKAECADVVASVAAVGKPVLPLIETALGYSRVQLIAGSPGVQRLAFGHVDFQQDLGIIGDGPELLHFRSGIVLASRLALIAPPLDGVCLAIDDADVIRRDSLNSRSMGFAGKLCIHPRQVSTVNEAFAPTEAEVGWARKVLLATMRSAVATVDGKMVDRPVIDRARAILLQLDEASQ